MSCMDWSNTEIAINPALVAYDKHRGGVVPVIHQSHAPRFLSNLTGQTWDTWAMKKDLSLPMEDRCAAEMNGTHLGNTRP
jgi:hypothetical protein